MDNFTIAEKCEKFLFKLSILNFRDEIQYIHIYLGSYYATLFSSKQQVNLLHFIFTFIFPEFHRLQKQQEAMESSFLFQE